jgi:hypothetical protein
MQVRRGSAALWLAVLALAGGCGSHHTFSGPWIVTVGGRIGSLHLDRSDRASVIAFAGKPDAERRGRQPASARFDALGYDCEAGQLPGPLPDVGLPHCRTIFFINARRGTLATFFTTSPRYVEGHGVRIGMRQASAERLLHRRLTVGCETNFYLSSPRAMLTIAFTGGIEKRHSTSVKGAHVYAFALHSPRHDVGVSDCL